jgi:hypothetical protein
MKNPFARRGRPPHYVAILSARAGVHPPGSRGDRAYPLVGAEAGDCRVLAGRHPAAGSERRQAQAKAAAAAHPRVRVHGTDPQQLHSRQEARLGCLTGRCETAQSSVPTRWVLYASSESESLEV